MSLILTAIYVVVGMVLLFGAAVFVHEFGHYWMARRRGMKVEAFAIGFGPKIFGWTRDGIEYSVRWIPAGGFVKLPQMITSESLEGGKSAESEHIPPASPMSKILVAFAGPFMNVVFAFVIATVIYFVGLPVPVNPSIIGYVDPDAEEYKLGIRQGDRIVAVNGDRTKSWQDVFEFTIYAQTNVIPVTIERAGVRNTYQLKADGDNALGLKMLNLDSEDHVVVGDVKSGQPASAAGLRSKDIVRSVAGITIVGQKQMQDVIGRRAGEPTEIVVERDGKRLALTVTPQKLDSDSEKARVGIAFANTPTKYEVMKPGPLPWVQVGDVWTKTVRTLNALFHSKQTGVGIDDLSGPPGILAMLAAQIYTDFRLALSFMVLLNVNLAMINLFPIPVLDGGHIVMAILEKIRRRPLNVKVVEWTTTAFAVLLITFMLYVSFNDVWRRSHFFKMMFQRETQIEQQQPAQSPAVPGSTH